LDPRTGEIRALAGIAFSAPQPPGSTFKIVTATAALEAGAVKPSTQFPVQTAAILDGVELENANHEYCGGSFRESFAHSCNSVFAPLGVKIGAQRIVNAALRYGWNAPPVVPGEAPSTIPPADEIRTPLEIGSTAIGQGKVLATPLRLASVAQVVASGGVRRAPTLEAGTPPEALRVTSRKVARMLARLMRDVVDYGARGHARPERPGGGAARERGAGHGRLVHRLRAGPQAADRGGGAARAGRSRGRHRGARCAARAGAGAGPVKERLRGRARR
jgi:peptidoglycan glycosyltransferase